MVLLARAGKPAPFLCRDLQYGDEGIDVLLLQTLLNADPATRIATAGLGSPGNETTFFGNATLDAAMRFQELYRAQVLVPADLFAPTGYIGMLSRAVLNSLLVRTGGTEIAARTDRVQGDDDEDTADGSDDDSDDEDDNDSGGGGSSSDDDDDNDGGGGGGGGGGSDSGGDDGGDNGDGGDGGDSGGDAETGLTLSPSTITVNTYTADRIGEFSVSDGGDYTFALPAGQADNDLFSIDAETGALSLPEPIYETDVTKTLAVEVTDDGGEEHTLAATVEVEGTIYDWNVATLATDPGGGLQNILPSSEDNSDALGLLQDRMLAIQTEDRTAAFKLTFPAGEYIHQTPGFMTGVKRFEIVGAGMDATTGTRFKNINDAYNYYEGTQFRSGWDPYQLTSGNPPFEHYGYDIETAEAGDRQVVLKEDIEAKHLSAVQPGRRVHISSGTVSTYPAYPPHGRFYERPIITEVSGTDAGSTITFDRPLRHTHRENLPASDSNVDFGPARILFPDADYSTSTGTHYPSTETAIIRDVRFLPNPNFFLPDAQDSAEEVQIFGAHFTLLEDSYMRIWQPQIAEKVVLRNIESVGDGEPDAQIRELIIEDSTIGGINGPNGPTIVTAENTTFTGNIHPSMQKFTCNNCSFTKWQELGGHYTIFTMDALGPVSEFRITNSDFYSDNGDQSIFGSVSTQTYTVGTEIAYDAATQSFTVAYPELEDPENPSQTPWGYLTGYMGDEELSSRVMYYDSEGTPHWGDILTSTADDGFRSTTRLTVDWETGGADIPTGTDITFHKFRNIIFDDVTFHGWSSVTRPDAANFDYYTSRGLSVPTSVWNITVTP